MPGMPTYASHLVAGRVREIDGQCLGHHGGLHGGPERPAGLCLVHPYPPARAGSAPEPTASMTPSPSLCDTIPPNAIGEPSRGLPLLHVPRVRPGHSQAHPDLAWSRHRAGRISAGQRDLARH
jgi:hypothetical protein